MASYATKPQKVATQTITANKVSANKVSANKVSAHTLAPKPVVLKGIPNAKAYDVPEINDIIKIGIHHGIKIYSTDMPIKLADAITSKRLALLQAPTGMGKSVMASQMLAHMSSTGLMPNLKCIILMPFRTSIKHLRTYLNNIFPFFDIGYAMRGDKQHGKHCMLETVGYFLSTIKNTIKNGSVYKNPMIVMIDEAHDPSWQTDIVIKILLWLQKNGAPIRIIISSATLDAKKYIENYDSSEYEIISSENNKNMDREYVPNYTMHFLKTPISSNNTLYENIGKRIDTILRESMKGDILIIMQGTKEIADMHKTITKSQTYKVNSKTIEIFELYSGLPSDEISEALLPIIGKRRILLATNIVENAITIDGLVYVIISGYNKVMVINSNGFCTLVENKIAISNVTQQAGRCGRQGIPGHVYPMMTKEQYQMLPAHQESEFQRNPIYHQLLLLLSMFDDRHVIFEILDTSHEKFDRDVSVLLKHNAITLSDNRMILTKSGAIMADLPFSLHVSHFMAEVIQNHNLDDVTRYIALVLSAFIDESSTLFYNPKKKHNEDKIQFMMRLDEIRETQRVFYDIDCIHTFINVWMALLSRQPGINVNQWCAENGLFDKTIKNIFHQIKPVMSYVNLTHHFDPQEVPKQMTPEKIHRVICSLMPMFRIAFADRLVVDDYFVNSNTYCYIDKQSRPILNEHPLLYIPMNIWIASNGKHIGSKILVIDKTII
jgi:HrpA-like RNA helicase